MQNEKRRPKPLRNEIVNVADACCGSCQWLATEHRQKQPSHTQQSTNYLYCFYDSFFLSLFLSRIDNGSLDGWLHIKNSSNCQKFRVVMISVSQIFRFFLCFWTIFFFVEWILLLPAICLCPTFTKFLLGKFTHYGFRRIDSRNLPASQIDRECVDFWFHSFYIQWQWILLCWTQLFSAVSCVWLTMNSLSLL